MTDDTIVVHPMWLCTLCMPGVGTFFYRMFSMVDMVVGLVCTIAKYDILLSRFAYLVSRIRSTYLSLSVQGLLHPAFFVVVVVSCIIQFCGPHDTNTTIKVLS